MKTTATVKQPDALSIALAYGAGEIAVSDSSNDAAAYRQRRYDAMNAARPFHRDELNTAVSGYQLALTRIGNPEFLVNMFNAVVSQINERFGVDLEKIQGPAELTQYDDMKGIMHEVGRLAMDAERISVRVKIGNKTGDFSWVSLCNAVLAANGVANEDGSTGSP